MWIAPFDAPEVARHVVFLTEEELQGSWRLVEPDGTKRIKGRAAVSLLYHLDATRYLGRILAFLRLHPVVGAIDAAISRARPLLSRLVKDDRPALKRVPPDDDPEERVPPPQGRVR